MTKNEQVVICFIIIKCQILKDVFKLVIAALTLTMIAIDT